MLPRGSQQQLERLRRRAARVLTTLKDLGADHAEVRLDHGQTLSASVRGGALELLSEAQSESLALRVVCDNRVAAVTTSDLRPEALDVFLARAVELARLAEEDPHAEPPPPRALARRWIDLDLFDPGIRRLTADRATRLAILAEAAALAADPRISASGGAVCSRTSGHSLLATSGGFVGPIRDHPRVAARPRDRRRCIRSQAQRPLLVRRSSPRPPRVARGRRPRGHPPGRPQPRRRPGADRRLPRDLLRRGRRRRRRPGRQLPARRRRRPRPQLPRASPRHPRRQPARHPRRRSAARPRPGLARVRRRGQGDPQERARPPRPCCSASCSTPRARAASTCARAPRAGGGGGTPHPTASNFYLRPGRRGPRALFEGVRRGLYVRTTLGHGFDPGSGHFSRGAEGALIEDGELTRPVGEITISRTLDELLHGIDAVASDFELRTAVAAPSFRVDAMTIAGT
jgi:PmbA protein